MRAEDRTPSTISRLVATIARLTSSGETLSRLSGKPQLLGGIVGSALCEEVEVMTLNGWPLELLSFALVIAAPVLTLVLWGRTERGAWRFPARGALLLLCQATAVLLVAAAPAPGRGKPCRYQRGSARTSLEVLGGVRWSSRSQWPTRGRVISAEIRGVRSQLAEHAFIYLPPQYAAAAATAPGFPRWR